MVHTAVLFVLTSAALCLPGSFALAGSSRIEIIDWYGSSTTSPRFGRAFYDSGLGCTTSAYVAMGRSNRYWLPGSPYRWDYGDGWAIDGAEVVGTIASEHDAFWIVTVVAHASASYAYHGDQQNIATYWRLSAWAEAEVSGDVAGTMNARVRAQNPSTNIPVIPSQGQDERQDTIAILDRRVNKKIVRVRYDGHSETWAESTRKWYLEYAVGYETFQEITLAAWEGAEGNLEPVLIKSWNLRDYE